jgi:hypothetical protein
MDFYRSYAFRLENAQSSCQLLRSRTVAYYVIIVVFWRKCLDLSAATFLLCETDVTIHLTLPVKQQGVIPSLRDMTSLGKQFADVLRQCSDVIFHHVKRDVSSRDWKWIAVSAWLSHAILSPALHPTTGMVQTPSKTRWTKTGNILTLSIPPRSDRRRHPIGNVLNTDLMCCLLSSSVGDELCYRFPICRLFCIVLQCEHVLMW